MWLRRTDRRRPCIYDEKEPSAVIERYTRPENLGAGRERPGETRPHALESEEVADVWQHPRRAGLDELVVVDKSLEAVSYSHRR